MAVTVHSPLTTQERTIGRRGVAVLVLPLEAAARPAGATQ